MFNYNGRYLWVLKCQTQKLKNVYSETRSYLMRIQMKYNKGI